MCGRHESRPWTAGWWRGVCVTATWWRAREVPRRVRRTMETMEAGWPPTRRARPVRYSRRMRGDVEAVTVRVAVAAVVAAAALIRS